MVGGRVILQEFLDPPKPLPLGRTLQEAECCLCPPCGTAHIPGGGSSCSPHDGLECSPAAGAASPVSSREQTPYSLLCADLKQSGQVTS